MRKSSSVLEGIKGLSALDHGPEHGDASPCECDERLDMVFSLAPFAVVEGFREWIFGADGAEGTLIEDALEGFVAAEGASPSCLSARLPDHRREPCGRGQRIGRRESPDVANAGDELCREHRPHARQRLDEDAVRVDGEKSDQVAVEAGDLRPGFQSLGSEFTHQLGHGRFAGHGERLGAGRGDAGGPALRAIGNSQHDSHTRIACAPTASHRQGRTEKR